MRPHCASAVLMAAPDDFGFNEETARDNEFQHPAEQGFDFRTEVMKEFRHAVSVLKSAGINVLVLEKNPALSALPDAVFPNNWFSTWPNGVLRLYPMRTTNRQAEVRPEELVSLFAQHGFNHTDTHSVTGAPGLALEGTGALVFDHQNAKVYAAYSERCDRLMALEHAQTLNYELIGFETCSSHGRPFYHTNVMLSVGEDFAVVCSDSIVPEQRAEVLNALKQSKRDVIEISLAQAEHSFCANVLQLATQNDKRVIALSANAFQGFSEAQKASLATHGRLLPLDIKTIEHMGGGSVRCMLGEIFFHKNKS